MAIGILGRKVGMTQIFDESGKVVAVTVIEAGPCHVLQLRTKDRDGYEAVQIGFLDKPRRLASRSERGHVAKLDSKRAKARSKAGVELAAFRLRSADEKKRPPEGRFHVRLSGTDVSVSFITEAARVDLNEAPKELLSGLLTVLGASDDDAKEAADRIVGWRTKASDGDGSKEAALYQTAGRTYSPRQAPFAHVSIIGADQLWIAGVSEAPLPPVAREQ